MLHIHISVRKEMYYFLNWELAAPTDNLLDLTQGNEVIEIYIQDINGCGPPRRYVFPITQQGQSFELLNVSLLYQADKCSNKPKDIAVSIRILRGLEERLIYTNDFTLLAPYYIDGYVHRLPIYRVWHYEDYYNMMLANMFSYH